MKMILSLSSLTPNPFRDFIVDPIDGPENDNDEVGYTSAVTKLRESIDRDGFWGGVVVRQHPNDNGTYQIAAGHHRIAAARLAGIESAELFVGNLSDDDMIRVYGVENATQRGVMANAVAGTVAAALKKVAMDEASSAGNFTSRPHTRQDQTIGRPAILDIIGTVPGMKDSVVRDQLATLKSSGDYRRIVQEVAEHVRLERERMEREAEEAARRAEEARKAREKREKEAKEAVRLVKAAREEEARKTAIRREKEAEVAVQKAREAEEVRVRLQQAAERRAEEAEQAEEKADKTAAKADDPRFDKRFDYEGVTKWLHNDNQVRAFRKWATGAGIVPYLPVDSQALVAKALAVHAAQHEGVELTAAFINTKAAEMLTVAKATAKQQDRKTQQELAARSWEDKVRHFADDFGRHARGMSKAGTELAALRKTQPKGHAFPIRPAFRVDLNEARDVINRLYKDLYGDD